MRNSVNEITDLNNFYVRTLKQIHEKCDRIVLEKDDFSKYFESLRSAMIEVMNQLYGCYASGSRFDFEKAATSMTSDISKNILAMSKIHEEDYNKHETNKILM